MPVVTLVVTVLLLAGPMASRVATGQAADTAPPAWFVPPPQILGCKAVRPPDTGEALQRYECGDAWVDVYIYDPARLGLVATPDESTVEAEFRVYLRDTVPALIEQGIFDSLAFDDLRPLCYAVPGGEVRGGLLQGTGARRGQMHFTAMAVFGVKGRHLKLRASGTRAWMFDPFSFSEALLRESIDWRK